MIPWVHPNPQPKRHLNDSAVFAQLTLDSPYLQRAAPYTLLSKLPLSMGRFEPANNT